MTKFVERGGYWSGFDRCKAVKTLSPILNVHEELYRQINLRQPCWR
jgi:hypothetical protein